MYLYFLYGLFFITMSVCLVKSNHYKNEWLFLLLIMSYVKTSVMYLFGATTVFTIIIIAGVQIHLDDVVLVVLLCCIILKFVKRQVYKSPQLTATLLLVIPMAWSLARGFLLGNIDQNIFLSDIRKFVLFLAAFIAVYLNFQEEHDWNRIWKWEKYLHNFMNVVLIYVLVVWFMDLALGINYLPGQQGGLLSDGGSTMRIVHPTQVLMIAFYALYVIYVDIMKRKKLSARTIAFVLIVFLMQWRTVVGAFSVAAIAEIVYLAAKGKFLNKRVMGEIFFIVVAGVIIVLGFGNSEFVDTFRKLFDSFSGISDNTGTYGTRTDVWTMLLNSLRGTDKLLGQPFGTAFSRTVKWEASAHSGYVDYIMKFGYLGVAMLVAFMLYIIVSAIGKRKYLIVFMGIMQLVFWYGYGFSVEQGALLGFFLAALNKSDFAEIKDLENANCAV